MEDKKRNYNCSDRNLYEVLLFAWDNYDENQVRFESFKGYYTKEYSETARAAILAARGLPDAVAREVAAEKIRLQMVTAAEVCGKNFKSLKSYIKKAFIGSELQRLNYSQAGQAYYREATTENWPSVGELNTALNNFIAANSTQLLANKNMPVTFSATCIGNAGAFEELFKDYKKAVSTGKQTLAKIEANNNVFRTTMDMMLDGQLIFDAESETKKMFVFTELYDRIAPPVSGVKGLVKTAENKVVPFAEIIVEREGEPDEIITADENGEYERRLASGPVKMTAVSPGLLPESVTETINLGSYKSFDFILKAA